MSKLERPTLIHRSRTFGGWTEFYRHSSEVCNHEMGFSVYIPPQADKRRVPILYWLSGLNSNDQDFMTHSGAQRVAARCGLMLVAPDTSPRGVNIPEATGTSELGEGAGFYVNATQSPWDKHYRMYDYVTGELPSLIHAYFPGLSSREGIFGHSMGGHGALVAALRQRGRYLSVSAFAPISTVCQSPWGRKALQNYLGKDENTWLEYDACHLISKSKTTFSILVDQGMDDEFLNEQLMPETLQKACNETGFPLSLRMHAGHDHSYYFITSFMQDHLEYHAEMLNLF